MERRKPPYEAAPSIQRVETLTPITRAERIRWAIAHSGKTQEQLAAAAGCSQSAIAQWVNGDTKRYDAERFTRFADACGVRTMWLLYGVGPQLESQEAPNDLEQRAIVALKVMEERAPVAAEAAVVMLEAAAKAPPN